MISKSGTAVLVSGNSARRSLNQAAWQYRFCHLVGADEGATVTEQGSDSVSSICRPQKQHGPNITDIGQRSFFLGGASFGFRPAIIRSLAVNTPLFFVLAVFARDIADSVDLYPAVRLFHPHWNRCSNIGLRLMTAEIITTSASNTKWPLSQFPVARSQSQPLATKFMIAEFVRAARVFCATPCRPTPKMRRANHNAAS